MEKTPKTINIAHFWPTPPPAQLPLCPTCWAQRRRSVPRGTVTLSCLRRPTRYSCGSSLRRPPRRSTLASRWLWSHTSDLRRNILTLLDYTKHKYNWTEFWNKELKNTNTIELNFERKNRNKELKNTYNRTEFWNKNWNRSLLFKTQLYNIGCFRGSTVRMGLTRSTLPLWAKSCTVEVEVSGVEWEEHGRGVGEVLAPRRQCTTRQHHSLTNLQE